MDKLLLTPTEAAYRFRLAYEGLWSRSCEVGVCEFPQGLGRPRGRGQRLLRGQQRCPRSVVHRLRLRARQLRLSTDDLGVNKRLIKQRRPAHADLVPGDARHDQAAGTDSAA